MCVYSTTPPHKSPISQVTQHPPAQQPCTSIKFNCYALHRPSRVITEMESDDIRALPVNTTQCASSASRATSHCVTRKRFIHIHHSSSLSRASPLRNVVNVVSVDLAQPQPRVNDAHTTPYDVQTKAAHQFMDCATWACKGGSYAASPQTVDDLLQLYRA